MTDKKRYRLVTKGDFDGIACAILLKVLAMIDEVKFCHPNDVETGNVEITSNDIIAGLPYRETAYMVFDNYPTRGKKVSPKKANLVVDTSASSTAMVIYRYFGGEKTFPNISKEMMLEVDKGYRAQYTIDDILYPSNWRLLGYLTDMRTGLEDSQRFSVSHYQMEMNLINYCKDHTILEILSLPEVEERLKTYFSYIDECKDQILRCSTIYYNLVVVDMRDERVIYPGNRFIVYALFPECNVSLQVTSDIINNKTIFVASKSIIDRSYKANIGEIMSRYGGGGHANAGTCRVDNDRAREVLEGLIKRLRYSLLKNLILGYFN